MLEAEEDLSEAKLAAVSVSLVPAAMLEYELATGQVLENRSISITGGCGAKDCPDCQTKKDTTGEYDAFMRSVREPGRSSTVPTFMNLRCLLYLLVGVFPALPLAAQEWHQGLCIRRMWMLSSFSIGGVLSKVFVKQGDAVKAGDPILELENEVETWRCPGRSSRWSPLKRSSSVSRWFLTKGAQ